MPIYNYVCKKCKAHFSRILKVAEMDEPQDCEKCSTAKHTVRVITRPNNFRINGSNGASTSPRGTMRRNR